MASFISCNYSELKTSANKIQVEYDGKVIPAPLEGDYSCEDSVKVEPGCSQEGANVKLANTEPAIAPMIRFQNDSFYIAGADIYFRVHSDVDMGTLALLDANDTIEVADTTTQKSKTSFAKNYITVKDYNRDGVGDVYIQTYCARNCGGFIYAYDSESKIFKRVSEVQNFDFDNSSTIYYQGGGSGRQYSGYFHAFSKDWKEKIILRFERNEDTASLKTPSGHTICIFDYSKNDRCSMYQDSFLLAHEKD